MRLTKQTIAEKLKFAWYELLAALRLLSVVLCAFVLACATCYAAGSATASDVAIKGGMSIIDGTFITAIFMGLSSVITAIGFLLWGHKKEQKLRTEIADKLRATITNDPLNTHEVPSYVTHAECKQHRCALEKRIDDFGPTLERIFKKLTEIDRKDEERINSVHRRVDPLIEKLSETRGEVNSLKDRIRDAASASTIGGTK